MQEDQDYQNLIQINLPRKSRMFRVTIQFSKMIQVFREKCQLLSQRLLPNFTQETFRWVE